MAQATREHLLFMLWKPEEKELISQIKSRFPHIDITYHQTADNKTRAESKGSVKDPILEELYRQATILVTLHDIPASTDEAPNLRWIHFFTAGIDRFLSHPCVTDPKITITTSNGIHGPPVAEWVLLNSLAFSRFHDLTRNWQKEHTWGQLDQHWSGCDWYGTRVGIAGYGSIGRQIAHVFDALGADIIAYTATPRPTVAERADRGYILPGSGDPEGKIPKAWYSGTSREELHDFLKSGLDMLVISLPLTPATRHMFGKAEFEALAEKGPRPVSTSIGDKLRGPKETGCFLLNIARGPIIDQDALIDALNSGSLRGAALDVTDPEPLPKEHPLWEAKNIIITSHLSTLGVEYFHRALDVFLTNLERQGYGQEMFNIMKKD
ncbi:uncharacterized protein Z520_10065 [Fonsecaea multimorphosa CBS 102226]|uniref:D-isomer specific 2-hydroxyacid dehydrogenase NAD-binding domain-containing protein n=1 Tax=Fonsecaea multimorphosa CBS 102226 TaxID=1442371 RepID=A0A0D2GXU0_9EURO|nr:uncharacterized protein Z520_10065 [Fonsecaea multimorphosa CBS 102226]KIX94355.1 hypothetical protein Z520_10065 [Fonsecaea multimorphosa CBS 102226]OAL19687.1 hypothetical protein AYO22_09559 [Fonsecaea multimorphosa]